MNPLTMVTEKLEKWFGKLKVCFNVIPAHFCKMHVGTRIFFYLPIRSFVIDAVRVARPQNNFL